MPGVSKAKKRKEPDPIRDEKKATQAPDTDSQRDFDTSFFAPVMLVSSKGDGKANASKDFTLTWFAFGSEVRIRSPRVDGDSVYVPVEPETGTRGPFGRILATWKKI